MPMGDLQLVSRIVVGSVLTVACVAKLLNFRWFVEVIAAYKLGWSARLNLPAAMMIVVSESAAAVGLLVWGTPFFSWMALTLFGLFGLVTAVNLTRGKLDAQCGCFGPKGARISWRLLVRNLSLTGLAWFSLAPVNSAAMGLVCILFVALFALTLVPVPFKFQLRNAVKEV